MVRDRKNNRLKRRITKINRQLLEDGQDLDQIMAFWEDCMAEAQIQHELPACNCRDPAQCDTWCRAKARFAMNPPPN